MTEKYPVNLSQLRDFYGRIAPIIESSTRLEAQLTVRNWNQQLFKNARSEAEVLMLMHGPGTSDRYLYGLCSAVVAMREENGGILPGLSDEQYELDREIQDSHRAAKDEAAETYFASLEDLFERKFPLSAAILAIMESDLRSRLRVPEVEIQEGFIPGYYRALRATVPLFAETELPGA